MGGNFKWHSQSYAPQNMHQTIIISISVFLKPENESWWVHMRVSVSQTRRVAWELKRWLDINVCSSCHVDFDQKLKVDESARELTVKRGRDLQLLSTFINSYQLLSTLINSYQLSSTLINFHQLSSTLINFHQLSSTLINSYQLLSTLINSYQLLSTLNLVRLEH
jgi:hypothetical protein